MVQIRTNATVGSSFLACAALGLFVTYLSVFVIAKDLAAAGFAPLISLPPVELTLPFVNEVTSELQANHRSDLINALSSATRGPSKERAKAEAFLLRQQSKLSLKGQVLTRLILARSIAGLSVSGGHVSGANAAYRRQLAAALQKAADLPETDRAVVLSYGMSVWRLAEGKNMAWSKPPFRLAAYAETAAVRAVIERAALEDLRAGHLDASLKKYKALATSLEQSPQRAPLDLRVLDLSHLVAIKMKKNKVYENALIGAYKSYLDPGLLGDSTQSLSQAKATALGISQRHTTFVLGLLRHASQPSTSAPASSEAVTMASNLLSTLNDTAMIENVKTHVARVYLVHRQYALAAAAYKDLAETKDQAKAKGYLVLAIRAQSSLAAWPEKAPWRGLVAEKGADREELLALYTRLDGVQKTKSSWFIAAQRGLLAINLGRQGEAFDLWQGLLRQDAAGTNAGNAAGIMLTAYQSQSLWQDLSDLAKLCIAKHLAPMYQGKALATHDMLALALLESGKQAYEAQMYAAAITKFSEVVREHAGFKRHDAAFFMLALAYRGAGRHGDGVKTLQAFVERYPRSSYYRQALLNGGDWSAPMTFEDSTIFFFNRFVKQYAKDSEAQRVRDVLTALYIGRGRYGEALGVLRLTASQSPDSAVSAQALVTTLDVEVRHGEDARAGLAAAAVLAHPGASPLGKAAAMAMQARLAAAASRYQDVERLAASLAMSDHPAAQEALGEARYLIAEGRAKSTERRDFNLELRDPAATLQARYADFNSVRQSYLEVCRSGVTSFCAPAMVRLEQVSMAFAKAAEDIEIQESLAVAAVQKFKNLKQSIMNDLANTSQTAEAKALAVTEAGQVDPGTSTGVLWQASTEFGSSRLTGEAGQGYVQWNAE